MIRAHWQDIVAGLIALAALVYYVRRRLRARGAACEGCPSGGCATDGEATPAAPPLIAIEELGLSSERRPLDQTRR